MISPNVLELHILVPELAVYGNQLRKYKMFDIYTGVVCLLKTIGQLLSHF